MADGKYCCARRGIPHHWADTSDGWASGTARHGMEGILNNGWRWRLRQMTFVLLLAALTGCASTNEAENADAGTISDPIEPVNRVFFEVNRGLDKMFLRPVTEVYVNTFPNFIRAGVHTLLNTISLPLVAVNDLLQGEVDRFMQTTARFVTNVTIGFGVLDVASDAAPGHDEDLGQTLAVWGVPSGPYLMLPLLGPSTIRDGIGTGAELYAAPASRAVDAATTSSTIVDVFSLGKAGMTAVDTRAQFLEQLDELERTSLDFYATIRSLYIQRRRDEIRNGKATEPLPIPEISFEPEDSRSKGVRDTNSPR